MFAIVVNEKGGEQKRLEFDKPEVTIGRVQGNDIILPKGNVSKRHSRIVLKDGKFIIVDLKSTNGTYVNGRKITSPLVVKGSDKIYIGDFILSIEDLAGGGAVDEDMPPPPPRRSPATVPPPPPRAGDDESEGDLDSDAPPERQPQPTRPHMPSSPALPTQAEPQAARPAPPPPAPAPAPPPPPRPTAPTMARTPSSPGIPAPAPPPPRPAPPTPAAQPPAPAPAPPATTPAAPQIKPEAPARPRPAPRPRVSDENRVRVMELRRELGARLTQALGIKPESTEIAEPDSDQWSRAENSASDLIDQLRTDGGLPGGIDAESLLRDVVAETVGLGPLDDLIADDGVSEVMVAAPGAVSVVRDGKRDHHSRDFSSGSAVERVVHRLVGRHNGVHHGLLEAHLANGWLLAAVLGPLASGGAIVRLKRMSRPNARLADLVSDGALTQQQLEHLETAVRTRKNVIVGGGSATNRATLIAALARAAEGERIVSIEEADELGLSDVGAATLLAVGHERRHAVAAALRLAPERLVVPHLGGAEALDVLAAAVAGADGVTVGVAASAAREVPNRFEALARLAREAPAAETLRDEIGRGFQLVVQLAAGADLKVADINEISTGAAGPVLRPLR
jgi:pilus assembly protein CpaF